VLNPNSTWNNSSKKKQTYLGWKREQLLHNSC